MARGHRWRRATGRPLGEGASPAAAADDHGVVGHGGPVTPRGLGERKARSKGDLGDERFNKHGDESLTDV